VKQVSAERLTEVIQLAARTFAGAPAAADALQFVLNELAARELQDAKVKILPVVTSLDIPAERVLQAAMDTELTSAVVMGYRRSDGGMFFASSLADGGNVLWLMAKCEHALVTGEPLQ
jgi:hypothetical protein